MNDTAIILNQITIPWNAILITFAVLTWALAVAAFYRSRKASGFTIPVFLPAAMILCFILCRMIYWYSHQAQFDGPIPALFSKDLAAFSLAGLLPGILLAALFVRAVKLIPHLGRLLDALSPATALGVTLFYLTPAFNNTCRGKNIIPDVSASEGFQLFLAKTAGTSGVEYRYAVYHAAILLMFAVFLLSLVLFVAIRKVNGIVFCAFLLCYSAAEFYIDSVRYDAGYFPFNGFVSIFQIVSAASVLGVVIYLSILGIKKKSFKPVFPIIWVMELATFGATGYLEYLVQRHGDLAMMLYSLMGLSLFCMAAFPCVLFIPLLPGKKKKK